MAYKTVRNIRSQHIDAVDITGRFRRATEELDTGQLVKDEFFTLFESVGALEIGDPKMDSGLLEFTEQPLEQYDVSKELLPEEVLGIMDQMLCHEVAWYMGYPLSQTLFTSIYIDRLLWPEVKSLDQIQFLRNVNKPPGGALLHRVLRAYCLGTIKCCDFVRKQICSQLYYEEEDFSSQLYNRQLLHDIDVDEVQLLLNDAQGWLENCGLKADIVAALEQRLLFRQELLAAYQNDAMALLQGDSSAYLACMALIPSIRHNHSMAVSVEDAFSLKLQTTLASSVPPRPMVNIAYTETLDFLAAVIQDAMDLAFLKHLRGNEDILHAICLFMSRKPQPAIYVRSLLQSFLYRNDQILGRMHLQDFILSDLQSLVLPRSKQIIQQSDTIDDTSDNLFQIASSIKDFAERVSQQYLNSFRSAALNRARLRRTLRHFVAEWDNLQVDGEQIDTNLQSLTKEEPLDYPGSADKAFSYPLSSWMYHYKLLQLRHIIQLGFEQTIYASEEIPGMLWYLSHICTTHLAHLNRMSFFVEAGGRSETEKKSLDEPLLRSVPEYLADCDHALWTLDRKFQEVRAHDNLAEALHATYVILQRHGLMANSSPPYSCNEFRYELRMKPFLPLAIPAVVSYDDFSRESALLDESDWTVTERAHRAASEARKSWENVLKDGWTGEALTAASGQDARKFDAHAAWTTEVKNNIRASIATNIAITTVKNRLDSSQPSDRMSDRRVDAKVVRGGLSGLRVHIPIPGEKGSYSAYWPVPTVQAD